MPLVVDSSVALVWCLPDEENELAARALRAAAAQGVLVPSIWQYEVANALRSAVSQRRVAASDLPAAVRLLNTLRVKSLDLQLGALAGPVVALALQHDLSIYDAAFVELSRRESLPLATLDDHMRIAATAAGCQLFA